jgi:hypothetical protein
MKTQLAQAVRKQFALEMAKRLPAFKTVSKNEADVYLQKVAPDLVFFVYLSISEGKDSFVLEIAANENETFPWTEMPGMVRDVAEFGTRRVWRFRISTVCGEGSSHSWVLGAARDHQNILEEVRKKAYLEPQDLEAQLQQVEAKVRDAVDKVCDFGISYFQTAAEKRGVQTKIKS